VWLLCAPSAEDLVTTIRSRCRVMTLRVPPAEAVASVLVSRDGIDHDRALAAARAAQGHVGRARRLALDPAAAARRQAVLTVPVQATSLGHALAAAAALVKTAEDEAKTMTEQLDAPEREALRQAFGEGATGKGVAKAMRGVAGPMKDLEDRQKSRATRVKRDTLDGALLDLAAFYRDVLVVQLGADVELVNRDHLADLRRLADGSTPEATLRRIQAVMRCRERLTVNVAPLLAVEEMTVTLSRGLRLAAHAGKHELGADLKRVGDRGVGTPLGQEDHPGRHEIKAVEEAGDLLPAAHPAAAEGAHEHQLERGGPGCHVSKVRELDVAA
jgi:DNA polymerase-3 subunit delta'